jgi:hypothetical protein
MSQDHASERTLSTTGMDSSNRRERTGEAPFRTGQEARQGATALGVDAITGQQGSLLPESEALIPADEEHGSPIIQIGSTTLARLQPSKRPNPSTVCEGCPAAVWYARGEKVLNYCRLMHLITWETGEKDPVTSCDGPAIASQ